MDTANIALEIFGIAVSVLLLFCCFFEKPGMGRQTTLFAIMLTVNVAVLLCDLLTWWLKGDADITVFLYILNSLVYSLGYVLTALFTYYLVSFVGLSRKKSQIINAVISMCCTVAIVFVVVSLFNHMYFNYDNAVYERGPLYWLSQVYPILILLFDMAIVFYCKKRIGTHDTISLLSYGILPVIAMAVQIFVYGITLLYIATTLSLLIIYITVHIEQSRKMQQQERELQQANISIMLSQIQPHFLFNSLSSISELCNGNSDAQKALICFSDFLRGNIDSLKIKIPIPFKTELQHIKAYLYLEKLHFQDRLDVVYDIKADNFSVPTLTVQPIVENAVKYGLGRSEKGGTVKISSFEEPDFFVVEVKDDGVGFDPHEEQHDGRTHIGIDNVRSRLDSMCCGQMTVESKKNGGTTVTIRIPKEKSSQGDTNTL